MTRTEYLDLREKIESRIARKNASDFRFMITILIFISGIAWVLLFMVRSSTWDVFIPSAFSVNVFLMGIVFIIFGISSAKQEKKALERLRGYDKAYDIDVDLLLESDEFSFLFEGKDKD